MRIGAGEASPVHGGGIGSSLTQESTMKKLSAVCLLALSPTLGLAGIVSPGLTVEGDGPYTWAYSLQLMPLQEVKLSQPTPADALTPESRAFTSFFTIHDFAGFVAGSCVGPAGWVCSARFAGEAQYERLLGDDTGTVDLTWTATATGSRLRDKSKVAHLGDFSAQSIYDDATSVIYTTRTTDNLGRWAESGDEAFGSTLGPTAMVVAEPGALALAGLGLTLLGLARREARSSPDPAAFLPSAAC